MKREILFILSAFSFIINLAKAQQNNLDSLKATIKLQTKDTAQVNALAYLANEQTQFDSVTKYAQQGILLARKINYNSGEADCFLIIARQSNLFSESIQYALSALKIYEEQQDNTGIASAHLVLQGAYWSAGDYKNGLAHALTGERIAEGNNVKGKFVFPGHRLAPLFLAEIGQILYLKNQLDSAFIYTQKSITQNDFFNGAKWNFPVYLLATIQTMQGDYKKAMENYRTALPLAVQNKFYRDTLQILSGISTLFKKNTQVDSAIYYAQKVAFSLNPELEKKNLLEAVGNLAQSYKLKGEKDSAIKYIELSHALNDSIFSNEKDREIQSITFNERLKQGEILTEQLKYKSKVQIYAMAAGLFAVLLIAGILVRNSLHRKRAYELLQKQKEQTDFQKIKAEQALEELTSHTISSGTAGKDGKPWRTNRWHCT